MNKYKEALDEIKNIVLDKSGLMIYFFAGFFIGGIASMLLYSLVVSERINELELENGRLIDDLNKAEYEARKYKYRNRGVSYDGFEETK